MAAIQSSSQSKVFQIKKWLGLNESPDGDTHMKMGEAAKMRNFRITAEDHLQIRPGYGKLVTLSAGKTVRGMWTGYIKGQLHLVAACGGHLWDIKENDNQTTATDVGAIHDGHTFFFGFADQLYLLTGAEYYAWDGEGKLRVVEGYIPIIKTAVSPDGNGTNLEHLNLLTGKRRAKFSPDGQAKEFILPESAIDELIAVEGTDISYTVDKTAGKLTFDQPPPMGTSSITVTWRKGSGQRAQVTGMKFAELFNGESDARVFLYGDGTNQAIYSGLDENGIPSAEYFPAFHVVAVDSANTPITSMIRHYDRMLIFKPDSAYSCSYATMTVGEVVTAAFYVSSLNRSIGNAAPGQARLVDNNARTLHGRSVYDWALAANSVRDERNAKRVSDKVSATLGEFDLASAFCLDDEWNQEYYIFCNGQAVVNHYENDTWYYYTNLPVTCAVALDGAICFGTPDGALMKFSREFRNDNLEDIDAYWESGSMDFDLDWRRKYSSTLWTALKPESQAIVTLTAESNVKSDYPDRILSAGLATFLNVNFSHWSFGTNRKPQLIRAKLKVKKATYYKLILKSKSASATATILSVDALVRYTGTVK